jgi:hypothetical protein
MTRQLGAVEERAFHPEELEIARALATQASSAVQLIRLVQAARQFGVLEERNRLAREIHDSLAPRFAGIAMQLAVAEEELTAGEGAPLCRVRLANKMVELGSFTYLCDHSNFQSKDGARFPDSERKANTVFSSGDRVISEWTLTAPRLNLFYFLDNLRRFEQGIPLIDRVYRLR